LNKILIFFLVGVTVAGILASSIATDQFADAVSRKKIHFTQTITSTQDPGMGHEGHQLAMILSPNPGTLYDGSVTFSSSEPVQVFVLHEINESDSKGQATWSADGQTIYGLSLIDPERKAGSFDFTGATLALHSANSKEFTVTVSLDGWIRGQPNEIIMQKMEPKVVEPSLLLSRANVPATIPMHKGVYNGDQIFYIATDSSDDAYAEKISDIQNWRVETATKLVDTPEKALQKIYVFTNGVKGDGIYGYQKDVFSSVPQNSTYSALSSVVEVTWKKGQNITAFESSDDLIKAQEGERVEFKETGIILNTPQVIWPDGQMKVRDDKEITDEMSYSGGQITEINKEDMTVTFVAHRSWGPDGRTIYYIVTDATPSEPAEMMGVIPSPTSSVMPDSVTSNLFQFQNGIKGSGMLGFQPAIASAIPGKDYSPIWKMHVVEWNDPKTAKVMESTSDLDYFKEKDNITVSVGHFLSSEYVLNCPVVDPFQ
jgi:hypothetical protein